MDPNKTLIAFLLAVLALEHLESLEDLWKLKLDEESEEILYWIGKFWEWSDWEEDKGIKEWYNSIKKISRGY